MDEKKMKELSIIGVTVKIKTSLGEEVQGEILSVDTVTNCIVLREDTGDQNASNNTPSNCSSFRILKINFVKEITRDGGREKRQTNHNNNLDLASNHKTPNH
eukprot:TRINITY_DN6868_c0_g1_i2.p1 TRINITY_DN6868_c0_g1~~TRINITY_DN6868_c0_g1_i2.p1  ORF type:complete len:102 (+),score=28.62 TRINITY_DN6868_c0_g1_i2:198-503(+)